MVFKRFLGKRTMTLALMLGMMSMLVVACGDDEGDGEGDGEDTTATAAATSTGTATGEATTAATESSEEELSGSLNIEGSSTVAPYTRLAIEAFEGMHPDVTITTGEIGSGGGITAFINQEVPIAAASRDITEEEIAQAEAAGLEAFETTIFNDALAIVVHPDNTVESLTLEQVAQIFAGQITNWSEVGGGDAEIVLYTRNEESGTFAYLEEDVIQAVLGDDAAYSDDINKQANAPAGLTAVAGDPNGIFYAGLGNLADIPEGSVRVVPVSAEEGGTAVEANAETVASGEYPIARGLYYYTNGDPAESEDPLVKAYIEFVLSDEGQAIGEEIGFLPVN